jgi:queuine tRNA-ribosyltransferase
MQGLESPYARFSRGYLRHLFMAGEMLGPMILSFHNVRYYQDLMDRARQAIAGDCFADFLRERLAGWGEAPLELAVAKSARRLL